MGGMKKIIFPAGFVLAAIVGCSTIENAREAQREVHARGEESGRCEAIEVVRLSDRSLSWMVGFALTNRPSVVAKRLAVEDARLALKEINADAPLVSEVPWQAPKIAFNGKYSESSRGTTMREHDFATSGDPSLGLSLELLLWDFGRHDARAKSQSEAVLAAEHSLVEEGYSVFSEVASAYFDFFEKAALYEVALTNETEYSEHFDRAKAMHEAGESQQLDVLRARLDYASARERTVNAYNSLLLAAVELTRSLGLEAGRVEPADFAIMAEKALTRRERVFEETRYSADQAFDFARTNAPAMKIVRARLRAAEADVDNAVANLLPKISADVSLNWANPLWAWSWGLGLVQNVYGGLANQTAVDRAVVAMRNAAATVDESEQQLSSSVASAVLSRDNARVVMLTAVESLEAAKENLQVVREKFGVGEASRVDYAEAVSSYTTELGNSVSAFYTEQKREVELLSLMGIKPTYNKGE